MSGLTVTKKLWEKSLTLCNGVYRHFTTPTLIGIVFNSVFWITFLILVIAADASRRDNRSYPSSSPDIYFFNPSDRFLFVFGYLAAAIITLLVISATVLLSPLALSLDVLANIFIPRMTISDHNIPRVANAYVPTQQSLTDPYQQAARNRFYQSANESVAKAKAGDMPDEFTDPITLDVISDPVLVYSRKVGDTTIYAHAYDKASIKQWQISSSNPKKLCAKTRYPIVRIETAPELKTMITTYQSNPVTPVIEPSAPELDSLDNTRYTPATSPIAQAGLFANRFHQFDFSNSVPSAPELQAVSGRLQY